MTELEALRRLEAAVKAKQASLEGFIQEYGEIIAALKEVEAAWLKDNEPFLKAQKEAVDDLKKEKEVMRQKMYERAAAMKDKNGMSIWTNSGKGGSSNGGDLHLYGGGSGSVASGSLGASDDAFYDAIKKYSKTMKF